MAQDKEPFGYLPQDEGVFELLGPQIQFTSFTQGVLDLGRLVRCSFYLLNVYLALKVLPNYSFLR